MVQSRRLQWLGIASAAACLLVSHDRSFLKNTGTRFWWISGRKLEEIDSPDAFLQQEMG